MVVSTRSKDTLNKAFLFDDKENENKENMKDKEHKQDEEEKEKKQEKKKIKEKTKEKTRKAAKDHEFRHRSSHLQDNTNKLKIPETTNTRNRPVKKQNKIDIYSIDRNILFAVIILIAVILLSSIGCNIFYSFLRATANGDTGTLRNYTGLNLGELKSSFPEQTPYLWRLIGSASVDFFKREDPKRPTVILLAAGPDAHSTLDALASNLSTSYTSGDRVTKIDGSKYTMSDADIAKYEIDNTLDSGFNSGKKVAVIHHLESIPAKASMIFHSYCETDNAPFKKVVIIFTVHITDELNPNDNLKTNEKKVEKHLIQKWKDSVDKDHIDAMFSRVATAVAFVTPSSLIK